MVTNTQTKRISRNKLMKIRACIVLIMLVLFGGTLGFFIGRFTAPVSVKTVTETVEVPTYEADKLPVVANPTYYDVPLSHSLQQYLHEVCADEEVPVTLVLAMIEHESGFNQEVVSKTDDYGLMQINKINHEWLKEDYRSGDMLNPYQNVFCGVKIIGGYLKKYDNDYTKALMAYNMGEYGAKKAWGDGINQTSYSTKILELMKKCKEVKNDK